MSRTPATQDCAAIQAGSRGIICNARTGGQRCRKVVLNNQGEIVCPNKHPISLDDLLSAFALNPESDVQRIICGFNPSLEAMRAVVRRLASAEFTGATITDSTRYYWMELYRPYFTRYLLWADICDQKSAVVLRKTWLERLQKSDRVVWEWLGKLSPGDRAMAMERCLTAWARTGLKDRLHYVVWSPIQLEAARCLNDQYLPFYELNTEEAKCVATGSNDTRIFFDYPLMQEHRSMVHFHLLIDPQFLKLQSYWKQVGIYFESHGGNMLSGHWTFNMGRHYDGEEGTICRGIEKALSEFADMHSERRRESRSGGGTPEKYNGLILSYGDHFDIDWDEGMWPPTFFDECLWAVEKIRAALSIGRRDIFQS